MNRNPKNRHGATLVLIVIMLPILFTLAAMAISISYTQLIRSELQIAVDASGRAAGHVYAITGDPEQAFAAAVLVGDRNTIGGRPFLLKRDNLEFGTAVRGSVSERYSFEVSENSNAVRLTVTPLASGIGVTPFFSGFAPSTNISPVKSAISTIVELDIALVIDRSGSMAYASNEVAVYPPAPAAAPPGWDFGAPVPPNARWLDTIAAVQVFNDELILSPQSERVSLVTYSHFPVINVSATEAYQTILHGLQYYSLAFEAGGTNIAEGINHGLIALSDPVANRPWASKAIVLMTDGIHNTGSNPESLAYWAAENEVMIFTVTFSDEANQPLMQSVASIGSGRHYHAANASQLRAAFRDIARKLPTLLTR